MQWNIHDLALTDHIGNPMDHKLSLEIFAHSIDVAIISAQIAGEIELPDQQKHELFESALYHDIGKSRIPPSILYKKGRLTVEEWRTMKQHCLYSEALYLKMQLKIKDKNVKIAKALRYHHENWDGTGYPEGLKGNEIPLYSRIIRIADIFDAITQPRVYRPYKIKNTMSVLERMKRKEIDPFIYERSKKILEQALNERFLANQANWKD
ncbi:HD-GYP domain-containing protein [Alkaliphilus crotonatoxidans]